MLRRPGPSDPVILTSRSFSRAGGLQQFASFSADGRLVAFAWNHLPLQRASLYTKAIDSETPVPLPGSKEGDTRPSFSPDGNSLAFVRELPLQGMKQIIIRDLRTSGERVLITLNGYAPWVCRLPHLSWAPDSSTLYTVAASVVTPGQPPSADAKLCRVLALQLQDGTSRCNGDQAVRS